MIFVTRWRRARAEAALAHAIERPLDVAYHPATQHQQEQAALVDNLLRQLAQKDAYIGQLESVLAERPDDALDTEFAALPEGPRTAPTCGVVSTQDLARLREIFTSAGIEFPEPAPGLSALEVLLWMMQWIVDHLLRQCGRAREEGE